VTIQKNYLPSAKCSNENTLPVTTSPMLLLCKLALLLVCFLIFQQGDVFTAVEFIARCEFSMGNIISVHAMIKVK